MRQSFPNRPFISASPPDSPALINDNIPPAKTVTNIPPATTNTTGTPNYVGEIVNGSYRRRTETMTALDAERSRREWMEEMALEQAARAEQDENIIDQYDAAGKIDRGQGNRKFVVNFAVAACATMATLVLFDAILGAARES